jgi:predicted permease
VLDAAALLGAGVSGLMILSLGMALQFPKAESVGLLVPVLAVKLAASPVVVFLAARALGMEGELLEAVTVEGAMPSQLLTFVIADRFKLNVSILALVIGLDTALAFLTIPFVHGLLF